MGKNKLNKNENKRSGKDFLPLDEVLGILSHPKINEVIKDWEGNGYEKLAAKAKALVDKINNIRKTEDLTQEEKINIHTMKIALDRLAKVKDSWDADTERSELDVQGTVNDDLTSAPAVDAGSEKEESPTQVETREELKTDLKDIANPDWVKEKGGRESKKSEAEITPFKEMVQVETKKEEVESAPLSLTKELEDRFNKIKNLHPEVYSLTLGGKSFGISKKFSFTDVQHYDVRVLYYKYDNGKVLPFYLYRSKSSGGWRLNKPDQTYSNDDSVVFSKGEHYTKSGRLVDELNAKLISLDLENSEPETNENSLVLKSHAKLFFEEPSLSRIKEELEKPILKVSKVNYSAARTTVIKEEIDFKKINKDFTPDFEKSFVRTYKSNHALLGDMSVSVFEKELDGKLFEFHVAEPGDGGLPWIETIHIKNGNVTSFGTYAEIYDFAELDIKPIEYIDQVPYQLKQNCIPYGEDGLYLDIRPAIGQSDFIKSFKDWVVTGRKTEETYNEGNTSHPAAITTEKYNDSTSLEKTYDAEEILKDDRISDTTKAFVKENILKGIFKSAKFEVVGELNNEYSIKLVWKIKEYPEYKFEIKNYSFLLEIFRSDKVVETMAVKDFADFKNYDDLQKFMSELVKSEVDLDLSFDTQSVPEIKNTHNKKTLLGADGSNRTEAFTFDETELASDFLKVEDVLNDQRITNKVVKDFIRNLKDKEIFTDTTTNFKIVGTQGFDVINFKDSRLPYFKFKFINQDLTDNEIYIEERDAYEWKIIGILPMSNFNQFKDFDSFKKYLEGIQQSVGGDESNDTKSTEPVQTNKENVFSKIKSFWNKELEHDPAVKKLFTREGSFSALVSKFGNKKMKDVWGLKEKTKKQLEAEEIEKKYKKANRDEVMRRLNAEDASIVDKLKKYGIKLKVLDANEEKNLDNKSDIVFRKRFLTGIGIGVVGGTLSLGGVQAVATLLTSAGFNYDAQIDKYKKIAEEEKRKNITRGELLKAAGMAAVITGASFAAGKGIRGIGGWIYDQFGETVSVPVAAQPVVVPAAPTPEPVAPTPVVNNLGNYTVSSGDNLTNVIKDNIFNSDKFDFAGLSGDKLAFAQNNMIENLRQMADTDSDLAEKLADAGLRANELTGGFNNGRPWLFTGENIDLDKLSDILKETKFKGDESLLDHAIKLANTR